jgi:hypothetical protein
LISYIHPAGIEGLGSQLRTPGVVDGGARLILVASTGWEPVFPLIEEGPKHIRESKGLLKGANSRDVDALRGCKKHREGAIGTGTGTRSAEA